MKFMKLGTRPDTFFTEEATRSVIADLPSDLVIRINNITYLLHKFALLPKCGLLRKLGTASGDLASSSIDLHDIPGGEEAFELCAKFCYGITINLSAHNYVPAICAAKFLRMVEQVEKGNLVLKLEAFFSSCILEGWKDSIITLQSTIRLTEWSENLGITRRCIDSVVEKVLTPPAKVTWSYTYTRRGFNKHQQPAPKDWWTEDISDLDIDLFRCIITAIRSAYVLPPQLIGEALHVYACRWLPDTTKVGIPESSGSSAVDLTEHNKKILESIVSMIPADRGSVSFGFLLRLASIANYLGANTAAKTELIRRSSLQLEEATVSDLLLPSHTASNQHYYDIDLVLAVMGSFMIPWRRQMHTLVEDPQFIRSVIKIGKLTDCYLQAVARDVNMPVSKFISLAEALPAVSRKEHNDLYQAINIYLKEHPDLSKEDKKHLCKILDCQKLSPEVRAHAIKNERLPLRTIVQVLFFDQGKGSRVTDRQMPNQKLILSGAEQTPTLAEDLLRKLQLSADEESSGVAELRAESAPRQREHHQRRKMPAEIPSKVEESQSQSQQQGVKRTLVRGEMGLVWPEKGKEAAAGKEASSKSKMDHRKVMQSRSGSGHGRDKLGDR